MVLTSSFFYIVHTKVTGDQKPKQLTRDLIRRILVAYGECDLAAADTLVQEMYQAAVGWDDEAAVAAAHAADGSIASTTTTNATLDVQSFGKALTHDIRLYDIRNETRMTTNFDDVYVTAAVVQAKEEEMLATVTNDEELLRAHKETQILREKLAVSEAHEHLFRQM